MKIILTTLTAICFAFLLNHSVHANSDRTERMVTKVTEKLSLSVTQQDLLRVYIGERKQLKQQRKQAKQERKANPDYQGDFAVFSDDSFLTVDQVNSIVDIQHAKRKEARQASIIAFVNFRNSLSIEQRQQGSKTLKRIFKMKKKRGKGKNMDQKKAAQ